MSRFRLICRLMLLLSFAAVGTKAQINITSANGFPWDLNNATGDVNDGGTDAFDAFGFLSLKVSDIGDLQLAQTDRISNFNLVISESNPRLVFSTNSVLIGGVSLARQLYMPPGTDFIRYFDTFVNTTAAPLKLAIAFQGNLGSDSGTILRATSSGDLVFNNSDAWGVTTDTGVFDPVVGMLAGNLNLTTIAGLFSNDPFSTPWSGNGNDGLSFVYSLTLGPGESSSILFYIYRGLSESTPAPGAGAPGPVGSQVPAAVAALNAMLANPDLSHLSVQQIGQIANFTAVPEPSTWALLASGGGLLLFGAWRRKSQRAERNKSGSR